MIDPLRFATSGEVLEGQGVPGDLKRLKSVLHDGSGVFHYRISGSLSARGHPQLEILVTAELQLTCQRCLSGMPYRMTVEEVLVMVPDESDLPALEEEAPGVDVIVRPAKLDVAELLEDEILLALPISPFHEAGECSGTPAQGGDAEQHPFAALARLKKPVGS